MRNMIRRLEPRTLQTPYGVAPTEGPGGRSLGYGAVTVIVVTIRLSERFESD